MCIPNVIRWSKKVCICTCGRGSTQEPRLWTRLWIYGDYQDTKYWALKLQKIPYTMPVYQNVIRCRRWCQRSFDPVVEWCRWSRESDTPHLWGGKGWGGTMLLLQVQQVGDGSSAKFIKCSKISSSQSNLQNGHVNDLLDGSKICNKIRSKP